MCNLVRMVLFDCLMVCLTHLLESRVLFQRENKQSGTDLGW